MAAPCTEEQARKRLKVPPAVSKAFTEEMLGHLKGKWEPDEKGGLRMVSRALSYPEALEEMHKSSGLQHETINNILRRDPKTYSISKTAIAKAGNVRLIRKAAESFAEQLQTDANLHIGEPGKIAQAWDLQRKAALAGHSFVFPFTHARSNAIQIPTKAGIARMEAFWSAAAKPYKYIGEAGKARYEMDMAVMERASHYDYLKSKSLDIVPGKRNPGDIILQQKKPKLSGRAFDSLKPMRYKMGKDIYDMVDPSIKQNPDFLNAFMEMTMRDLNSATGSVMKPIGAGADPLGKTAASLSELAGHYNLMMSSKLGIGKHMEGWLRPLAYGVETAKGLKTPMTPAMRAARNVTMGRWANTVAAHAAILGANYAFNKAFGFQTPNLGDLSKENIASLWRLKIAGQTVPFSPILEALRVPVIFTAAMFTRGSDTAGQVFWRTVWNMAHPAAHTLYEQGFGKDFRGRPVPSIRGYLGSKFPALAPKISRAAEEKRVTPVEYFSTRFTPIAISGGLEEYYQALRDHGLDEGMSKAFIQGAVSGASSALVGVHMYEEEPKSPKSTGKRGRSRNGEGGLPQ